MTYNIKRKHLLKNKVLDGILLKNNGLCVTIFFRSSCKYIYIFNFYPIRFCPLFVFSFLISLCIILISPCIASNHLIRAMQSFMLRVFLCVFVHVLRKTVRAVCVCVCACVERHSEGGMCVCLCMCAKKQQ